MPDLQFCKKIFYFKQNKIIPALQSRCTKFKFKQIPLEDARDRIKKIAEAEGLKILDEAIDDIIKLSDGDMRKVVNMLQVIVLKLLEHPYNIKFR